MNIKEALVERLLGDAEIESIVGDLVRPVQAAQDDDLSGSSGVVYQRRSGRRIQTLDGYLQTGDSEFDLACFAPTQAVADTLAEAVRRRLTLEAWAASSDDSVLVKCVTEEDVADAQEVPLHAGELAPYRVDLAFSITHQP